MNSKAALFELYATWKHLSSQCCHTLFEKAVITGHFSNCLHACVFMIRTTLLACSRVDSVKTPDMRLGLVPPPAFFFRQSGEWTHADWLWDCVKGYSTSCRPSLQTARPENIGSAIFVFPCHVWTHIVWLLKSLYGNIILTSLPVILVKPGECGHDDSVHLKLRTTGWLWRYNDNGQKFVGNRSTRNRVRAPFIGFYC